MNKQTNKVNDYQGIHDGHKPHEPHSTVTRESDIDFIGYGWGGDDRYIFCLLVDKSRVKGNTETGVVGDYCDST